MAPKHRCRYEEIPTPSKSWLEQFAGKFNRYVAQCATYSFLTYLGVRLLCLVLATETNLWMWGILFTEAAFANGCLFGQGVTILTEGKDTIPPPSKLRLLGQDDLPLVDVLITCCGEPLDVIKNTICTACLIDYPASSFRVNVLDDGNSSDIRQTVNRLRQRWPNLYYETRGEKKELGFAKAGNMNHFLFNVKREPQPELVAILDADNIPTPDFLRGMIPHFIERPKLAAASPRMCYYNIPPRDPLDQLYKYYSMVLGPSLNKVGKTIAAGGGSVHRHSVMMEMHGFPTITFAEDVITSYISHYLGYEVITLQDLLYFGLGTTTYEGHVAQRTRWSLSMTQQIQVSKDSKTNTVPVPLRKPLVQGAIAYIVKRFGWLIGVAILPFALASGQQLVPAFSLRLQAVLAVTYISAFWLHEWLRSAQTGFQGPTYPESTEFYVLIANLSKWALYYLLPPKAKASKPSTSEVTGSSTNPWNNANASRLQRLYRDFVHAGVWFNVLYFTGLLTAIYACVSSINKGDTNTVSHLFTRLTWPPVLNICYLLLCSHFVPLRYTLWPLKYPTRESLFGPHPNDSSVGIPTAKVKKAIEDDRQPILGEFGHLILVPVVLVSSLLYSLSL